jgi:6,7-dimethyl-8-ribityllumazine synthase
MTVATYETNLSGENLRIGVVQARFNEDVCHGLLSACLQELRKCRWCCRRWPSPTSSTR